jgi:hypothetical protein
MRENIRNGSHKKKRRHPFSHFQKAITKYNAIKQIDGKSVAAYIAERQAMESILGDELSAATIAYFGDRFLDVRKRNKLLAHCRIEILPEIVFAYTWFDNLEILQKKEYAPLVEIIEPSVGKPYLWKDFDTAMRKKVIPFSSRRRSRSSDRSSFDLTERLRSL